MQEQRKPGSVTGAQNIWEQLLLVRKESSPGRHTRRMSGSAVWRTVFLELTIRIPRWYMETGILPKQINIRDVCISTIGRSMRQPLWKNA